MSRLFSIFLAGAMLVGLATPAEAGVLKRRKLVRERQQQDYREAYQSAEKAAKGHNWRVGELIYRSGPTMAFRVEGERRLKDQVALVVTLTGPGYRNTVKQARIKDGLFNNSGVRSYVADHDFAGAGADYVIFPLAGTKPTLFGRLLGRLNWTPRVRHTVTPTDAMATIERGPQGEELLVVERDARQRKSGIYVQRADGAARKGTIDWEKMGY